MSNTRDNLPSLQYWQIPTERVPQRFYVASCLLMSSVQDAILGQKERETNNLNWSAISRNGPRTLELAGSCHKPLPALLEVGLQTIFDS